jgi:hypothetical protein
MCPVSALNVDAIGADLPSPADLGVDQGLLAASVGRTLGDGDELLGL